MKLALALEGAGPAQRVELALEAERRELESVWLLDRPGEDSLEALAALAACTRTVRLGVFAHDLAARAPIASAARLAALDRASGGRLELGVHAPDPSAAAEALTLLKRLWCDPWVEHRGAHFSVSGTAPSERPQQRPWGPVYVEGESEGLLLLAARSADGWLTRDARPQVLGARLERLRELRARSETLDGRFAVNVYASNASPDELAELESLGVDRVLVGVQWLERGGGR